MELSETLLQVRWLVFTSPGAVVPASFVSVLLFWLTVTFASFGLFAPRNATVVTVLSVFALSVAGAIFLILELDGPFRGFIRVSRSAIEYALGELGA
jgi:hypothetical protein